MSKFAARLEGKEMYDWEIGSEKAVVRIALECHNSAYSTAFSLRDRAEDIFPELRGQKNWDWVCIDDASRIEGAIEVKRLTRELPESVHGFLRKVGQVVSEMVQGRLQGAFLLYVGMLHPSVGMDRRTRLELVGGLAGVVSEMAINVSVDKTLTIKVRENRQLSEVLPQGSWLDLHRIDPSRLKPEARLTNFLHVEFGWASMGATERLTGDERVEFRKLVRKADEQFAVAKERGIEETFLVLAELGYSGAAPDAIKRTVYSLNPSDYSHIKHIYLVGFEPASRIGGTHDCIKIQRSEGTR